jgi:hypothetical protein
MTAAERKRPVSMEVVANCRSQHAGAGSKGGLGHVTMRVTGQSAGRIVADVTPRSLANERPERHRISLI